MIGTKVGIGIIGAVRIFEQHARACEAFKRRARLLAIADIDDSQLRKATEQYFYCALGEPADDVGSNWAQLIAPTRRCIASSMPISVSGTHRMRRGTKTRGRCSTFASTSLTAAHSYEWTERFNLQSE